MSILNGGDPYVPGETIVHANNIYRGAVDRAADRGAVDLALVPAEVEEIEKILFVLNLVNPGYFDAGSGFVGNDMISTPVWAFSITSFDHLEVLSASDVSGEMFTVIMPNDKVPDF